MFRILLYNICNRGIESQACGPCAIRPFSNLSLGSLLHIEDTVNQCTIPAEEIHADRNFLLGKSTTRITDTNVFRGTWNESLVAVRVLSEQTVFEVRFCYF